MNRDAGRSEEAPERCRMNRCGAVKIAANNVQGNGDSAGPVLALYLAVASKGPFSLATASPVAP